MMLIKIYFYSSGNDGLRGAPGYPGIAGKFDLKKLKIWKFYSSIKCRWEK